MARIDINGRQIGWLTVIERMPYAENSHRLLYKCRCKCGDEDLYERSKLVKGLYPACKKCQADYENIAVMRQMTIEIAEMFENEKAQAKETKRGARSKREEITLSDEQQVFVDTALLGKNILVDACIGSGKTTAIQRLCDVLPSDKNVLYLTYNRLLKVDARKKIHNRNVLVTNYHGYAHYVLKQNGISAGVNDLIQTFLKTKPVITGYDVLIIDEYQDIEQEFADMLYYIKEANPCMQIIAVGDYEQKIYDKTTLDVQEYMKEFLGSYEVLQFTKCFRLSEELAAKLGRVWDKEIHGVNEQCIVEAMELDDVIDFLASQETRNILCLGSRTGSMAHVLNRLELDYPDKFNKKTVFASIQDQEGGKVDPKKDSAIFTTYDSSKGMERPVCVVFDYTENYWFTRLDKPLQDYKILRNIFCVAASRGKEHIIFVKYPQKMLTEEVLSTPSVSTTKPMRVPFSGMFDFKFRESIEKCYGLLDIRKVDVEDTSEIKVRSVDGLIDLSPCIGIFQEASYFSDYDIDNDIKLFLNLHQRMQYLYTEKKKRGSVEEKILLLTALETRQLRYMSQVDIPFVPDDVSEQIHARLSERLERTESVQVPCKYVFSDSENGVAVIAEGAADVVKNDTVYELKFVSDLQHEHFLQCAGYMLALGLDKGILWNTKKNEMYEIRIPNKKNLSREIFRTVTKNTTHYVQEPVLERFAVIDTETTYGDDVMSIGVVLATDSIYEPEDAKYYILTPEADRPAMYSDVLYYQTDVKPVVCSRKEAISDICGWLNANGIRKIFAYNASFDMNHMPEMNGFIWVDIMKLASNINYNWAIKDARKCYNNGRLKKGYGVEPILQMLTGDRHYSEVHNAICDANDELYIMKLLELPLEEYDIAYLNATKPRQMKNVGYSKQYQQIAEETIIREDEGITESPTDEPISQVQSTVSDRPRPEDFRTFEPTYTAQQVADMLGVSKSTVYNLLRSGEIASYKKGNRYIIKQQYVEEYIERKEQERRNVFIFTGVAVGIMVLFMFFLFGM